MPQPKVALFDIETAPSLGYFWGKTYETDIIKVHKAWHMLCFSYKWLGERTIHTHSLRDYPGYRRNMENDGKLVRDLHHLFDEADILVAHNGDRFDIKATNARFLKHGLKPPSTYRTIDTLKIARANFRFESNRLNDLGQFLGVGGKKVTTGFDLWQRAMQGDDAAWSQMERYNRRDVELLGKVFVKLQPYAKTHPTMAVYNNGEGCPRCQSHRITSSGRVATNTGIYRRLNCKDCGFSFKGDKTSDQTLPGRPFHIHQEGAPCPHCQSLHIIKVGFKGRAGGLRRQWRCQGCKRELQGELVEHAA